jgi:hypothetical protein
MTARSSRRVLFVTFALVVPLPFFLLTTGVVPAARLLMLGGVALAILATEGTQGAVGVVAALLLGQALLYLVGLWLLAHALSRWIARGSGRRTVAATLLVAAVGLTIASAFDLYRTPFRTRSLHGNLFTIFE